MRIKTMVAATALAAGWSAAAPAAWQEASSRHFVVYSDDEPDKVRDFTARLERYDHAMRIMRGRGDEHTSRASRVTVFVLKNVSAVQHLLGDDQLAGVYIPRAAGSVAFTPRTNGDGTRTALTAQAVLLHEYAHHITYLTWGGAVLPAWFVEGFAEFNATATFNPDGGMTFGLPPYYRAREMLDLHAVPIRTLLTADPNLMMPGARQVFYGRAWLLVHYLTFDETRRRQLTDYLARIGKGEPAMKAATVFGDPTKLDVELNRYALRKQIATLTLPASELPAGEVAVRALTPAEATVMPALMLSRRGVDRKSAGSALALARTAAAAYPADPAVQNELAEAAFDAEDYAVAESAATRALAAEPRSIHALMYAGMARAAAAAKAKDSDAVHWQAIRRSYTQANRLDADDPWPLAAFYRSYVAAGQVPTANAEEGLLYAYALAPFDDSLGVATATVYFHRNKPNDAMRVLTPIAANPHGGYEAALARATQSAMNRSGPVEAARVLAEGKVTKADLLGTSGGGK